MPTLEQSLAPDGRMQLQSARILADRIQNLYRGLLCSLSRGVTPSLGGAHGLGGATLAVPERSWVLFEHHVDTQE